MLASRSMAEALTRAEVERIARLAHLALTDEEIETFTRQLGDILRYAQQIQAIDTSGVPPTSHVLAGDPIERDDELRARTGSRHRAEPGAGRGT